MLRIKLSSGTEYKQKPSIIPGLRDKNADLNILQWEKTQVCLTTV